MSPRSSTFVSPESKRLTSYRTSNFSFCGRILYNFRDIGRGRVQWPWNIWPRSLTVASRESCSCGHQWRRQTTKLGSAFKGQLYCQVGQMEGPKVSSEAPERRGGWGLERSAIAHPLRESGAEKNCKKQLWNHVFSACLQIEMVSSALSVSFRLSTITVGPYIDLERYGKC